MFTLMAVKLQWELASFINVFLTRLVATYCAFELIVIESSSFEMLSWSMPIFAALLLLIMLLNNKFKSWALWDLSCLSWQGTYELYISANLISEH